MYINTYLPFDRRQSAVIWGQCNLKYCQTNQVISIYFFATKKTHCSVSRTIRRFAIFIT